MIKSINKNKNITHGEEGSIVCICTEGAELLDSFHYPLQSRLVHHRTAIMTDCDAVHQYAFNGKMI